MVAQTHRKREAGKEKRRKIAVSSTKMLEVKANMQQHEDTEEMMQWKCIGQDGMNELWKELYGNMEDVNPTASTVAQFQRLRTSARAVTQSPIFLRALNCQGARIDKD